jgi:hypothetical protein
MTTTAINTAPINTATFTPQSTARDLADKFITFLETGTVPDGLFTPDVFVDLSVPQRRLQTQGVQDAVALRGAGHQGPSRVPRSRLDATATGFVLEIEERWEHGGERWYCRELFRAGVHDGSISELSIYCTGDWDQAQVAEHARAVTLLKA